MNQRRTRAGTRRDNRATAGRAFLRRLVPLFALFLPLFAGHAARAWDPSTTHAGLTERALQASHFHRILAHQLGRALGAFEPVHLEFADLHADRARSLRARLTLLDPAGGYRPTEAGIATASAWVRAGAVLELTPPERGRNHFLDPRTRTGLDDGPGLSGAWYALRQTFDTGATVRQTATGQTFALSGMSALEWLESPANDLGLPVFFASWERAASAGAAGERDTAFARGLLALGGILSVLEDLGQPAFVRNDFRGEFLRHDTGSEFEAFVAKAYGAVALPAAETPVSRADWQSYFVAGDGNGLAQETQRSFFSPGSTPKDFVCEAGDLPSDLVRQANLSLRFPEPSLTSLDIQPDGRTHYVMRKGVRILAYQRIGRTLHFFLDPAVYADSAARWLPHIEAYAAGLIDLLLRARVVVTIAAGKASLTVEGTRGAIATGARLRILVDNPNGERKQISSTTFRPGVPISIAVPAGARRIVGLVRGHDSAGEFVAIGQAAVP